MDSPSIRNETLPVKATPWILLLTFLVIGTLPVWCAQYDLIVGGLGGEPEYDQRFTGLANDLDKLFQAAGGEAHVYKLTGKDATRARLERNRRRHCQSS